MTRRTFDRIVRFDKRSRQYPVRALIPPEKKPRSYTWRCLVNLDQGEEGACVGFAWAQELAARPVVLQDATEDLAFRIYREAQKLDEWEGEAYEGTSVIAGAKAVEASGHLTQYRWAFGLEDLILAIGYAGPAVLGINWHAGMFEPDANGYLRPTGDILGGHAILCNAVSVRERRFTVHNSWGSGWGRVGTAWISFDDMGELLRADGEACIPVKRTAHRPPA